MMKKLVVGLFLASLTVVSLACGGADIGEACETEGNADECADGAICGKRADTDTSPICLKICTSDSDCASGENCNGLTGSSTKACRIK